MTISTAVEPVRPSDEAAAKRGERRALGVACGAHMLHDGYTDLVWVALPIWQAEFGLNYAMVGLLRTIYSGNLPSLRKAGDSPDDPRTRKGLCLGRAKGARVSRRHEGQRIMAGRVHVRPPGRDRGE